MAPESRPKRVTITAACEECRSKKTKCDGYRPVCTRCRKRGLSCEYRTEPDESRMEAVRRRLRMMEQQTASCEAVLRLLMQCPEEQAVNILRRLRSSESVASILSSIHLIEAEASNTSVRPRLPVQTDSSGSVRSSIAADTHMSASSIHSGGSAGSAHSATLSTFVLGPENSDSSISDSSISSRKEAVDRQSIRFLLSNNLERPALSGDTAHAKGLPNSESQSTLRASSYARPDSEMPDYTPEPEPERRMSEPDRASVETHMRSIDSVGDSDGSPEPQSGAQTQDGEPPDWDTYYSDVSSLLQWLKTTAPKKQGR